MTMPRQKKASKSSDAPSRKNSRSDANACDASNHINGIFGPVGSRTRSRSSSASAPEMKRALNQHLDKIAAKKERNAKQEATVKTMSRTEEKQPQESARLEEVPTSSTTQDLVSADAIGSAELTGSQLSVRSSSQISQGSYGVSTPAELRDMLGNSDQDEDEDAPTLVASDNEDDDSDHEDHEDDDSPTTAQGVP